MKQQKKPGKTQFINYGKIIVTVGGQSKKLTTNIR